MYGFLFPVPRDRSAVEVLLPGVDFRAVRELISMTDVLELLGWRVPTRSGPARRGPCPVHRSHSASSRSFAVHLHRQLYCCFRCGSSGNHLDLYAAVTRQGAYAAAVDLCQRLGRPIPWLRPRR
jgi:DNA primase